MNKNLQKFFYFFFWWNILLVFRDLSVFHIFVRFSFLFVLISAFYLFKDVFLQKKYRTAPIAKGYKVIMSLLLFWVFINIFRTPPGNIKGFLRFLGGEYYVAAWYPLLFFYLGSKISFWSQAWHYALKFNKLFVLFSPVIIFLFLNEQIWWVPLSNLFFLLPLLLVNWNLLTRKEKRYVLLSYIVAILITFAGGSRGSTVRLLYYVPVIFWIILVKKQRNHGIQILQMSGLLIIVVLASFYVYNSNISSYFSGDLRERVAKFERKNFKNSRELYAYPDFFADMKTTKDWVFGRGINGSYFSPIFVNVMKDLDPSNSLGVKKGYRVNIEAGYLQTILKTGLIGLVFELIIALSAIYLGLFKSKNWFVRGAAFIIIEWLFAMYPVGLPKWSMSYMLFWMAIGVCLSKETRMATSSLLFIKNIKTINKTNPSFFNPNRF